MLGKKVFNVFCSVFGHYGLSLSLNILYILGQSGCNYLEWCSSYKLH